MGSPITLRAPRRCNVAETDGADGGATTLERAMRRFLRQRLPIPDIAVCHVDGIWSWGSGLCPGKGRRAGFICRTCYPCPTRVEGAAGLKGAGRRARALLVTNAASMWGKLRRRALWNALIVRWPRPWAYLGIVSGIRQIQLVTIIAIRHRPPRVRWSTTVF